jgi:hypothetical protein
MNQHVEYLRLYPVTLTEKESHAAAAEIERLEAELARVHRILMECANHDRVLVPTGRLGQVLIAQNRACDLMIVLPDGIGFCPVKRSYLVAENEKEREKNKPNEENKV